MLYPGVEGVTEVDTNPKGRFMSCKVTPSNNRVLCVYTPSGHSSRQLLVRGLFKRLQKYMGNKRKINENK